MSQKTATPATTSLAGSLAQRHEAKIIVKVDKEPAQEPAKTTGPALATAEIATSYAERPAFTPKAEPVRKKFTQPNGKLTTANPGIKDILDPPKNKQAENLDALIPDTAEHFTFEELKTAWNQYALDMKREMKDSLYSTLMDSDLTVTSDYQITLEISNSAQAIVLEREKSGLLGHLRMQLKNYRIGFSYKISEKQQSPLRDNKSTFETLAAENPSLHKLRKLFNLDIEY